MTRYSSNSMWDDASRSRKNGSKNRSEERIRVENLEYGQSVEFGDDEYIKYRSMVTRLNKRKDIPFRYAFVKLRDFDPPVYSVYISMLKKEWTKMKAERDNLVRMEKLNRSQQRRV